MSSHYISQTAWIWSDSEKDKVTPEVTKLATSYMVRLRLGHSQVEFQLSRDVLVSLRDKIDNCLLDN